MSGEGYRPGISRLDQPGVSTRGWQVRLQRKGVRFGRFFSDSAWGGRANALKRAIRFRDRLLSQIERKGVALTASPGYHALPASRESIRGRRRGPYRSEKYQRG